MTDDLNPAEIDAAVAGSAFQGRMQHFATIGSTNTHALGQARQGAAHGTFYVADEQTAGRGRSDHAWHSNAGEGLYLSVLIRPEVAATELTWLPLLAGLAAHRAIREVATLDVDLRWPNDLLIGPKKTGGILVESLTESGRVSAAVIGIGINLHQRSFPPGLGTQATSLDLESGQSISRQFLLITLLLALHAELPALKAPTLSAAIPARIAAISTWVEGRRVEVHGPQACAGITAGLDARGFLRVQTESGVVTITTGGIRDVTS